MNRSTKLIAFLVFASTVFYLWPFAFRPPWYSVPNGAAFGDGGTLRFETPGIVLDRTGGRMLYESLKDGRAITVAVAAETFRNDQTGPARLVSLSADPLNRNFTLGQYFGDLIFRLRTPATGDNGIIAGLGAKDAFLPGRVQVLVATYDGERVGLYVDGHLFDEVLLDEGAFGGWDPEYPLVFGNEATGTRPWLGGLRDVAIYDTALSSDRISGLSATDLAVETPDRVYSLASNCLSHEIKPSTSTGAISLGTCEIPRLMRVSHTVELLSLKSRDASDYLHGVIVWLPIGLMLGKALPALSPRTFLLVLAAWAGLLESVQMFVPARSSSLLDLLTALAAGLAGYLISRRKGGAVHRRERS